MDKLYRIPSYNNNILSYFLAWSQYHSDYFITIFLHFLKNFGFNFEELILKHNCIFFLYYRLKESVYSKLIEKFKIFTGLDLLKFDWFVVGQICRVILSNQSYNKWFTTDYLTREFHDEYLIDSIGAVVDKHKSLIKSNPDSLKKLSQEMQEIFKENFLLGGLQKNVYRISNIRLVLGQCKDAFIKSFKNEIYVSDQTSKKSKKKLILAQFKKIYEILLYFIKKNCYNILKKDEIIYLNSINIDEFAFNF